MTTLNPSDLGEDAFQGSIADVEDALQGGDNYFHTPADNWADLPSELVSGSDSITMVSQDGFDANIKGVEPLLLPSAADEEARMLSAPGSDVNSPRDIVSPSGELSSPFSAMESDGEGIETGQDEASLSCTGDALQRSNGIFGTSTPLEYTTTPCASSSACDDDYESTGSRKKRKKSKRHLHPYPNGPSLRFNKSANHDSWHHDSDKSPFSPPTCPKGLNFNFAENGSRRSSGGLNTSLNQDNDCAVDSAKRTRTSVENNSDMMGIKTEVPSVMDTPVSVMKSATRRRPVPVDEKQTLHNQFSRKVDKYELRILSQPESQHRARYLTEGSRGPVKDSTQQGFPKVELLGYDGPAKLQVFVATDSGKIRPHGFYQACKVTGRNTSNCDETEIDGTKVIEIPFKSDTEPMTLNVDCVGILKLRNTDVEVRTGLRNQKRNQSVRLVFRVKVPSEGIILQIASTRISCTQPLGQPEITKKSIDRCSVEGGTEMFIIGKNFHRGTKVIYQDPEEPKGMQWSAEGEVDKDTFHQYHMVVRVPPYHDQTITRPVNVQLLVEFQGKKCEPHSFTYVPKVKELEQPKEEATKTAQDASGTPNIESALSVLGGQIDKKFLVALFSKLLSGGITQADQSEPPELLKPEPQPTITNQLGVTDQQAFVNAAPLLQTMLLGQTQTNAPPSLPNINKNPAPNATGNPFADIHFVAQPTPLASTNPGNPIQPAVFTPQLKFTPTAPVDLSAAQLKVKSENPDPGTMPGIIVTTTLAGIPVMSSSVNQTTPLAFVQPATTQNAFAPPVQNPQPIVVNPASFQNTQPSEGMVVYNSLAPSNTITVTQSAPNPTYPNPTPVVSPNPPPLIPCTQPSAQVIFGDQTIQQQQQPLYGATVSSPPVSTIQSRPVPNYQDHQQNVFSTAQQNSAPLIIATTNPMSGLTTNNITIGQPVHTNSETMQFTTNPVPVQHVTLQQQGTQFQTSFTPKDTISVVQMMAASTPKEDVISPVQSAVNTQPPMYSIPNTEPQIQGQNQIGTQQFNMVSQQQPIQQQEVQLSPVLAQQRVFVEPIKTHTTMPPHQPSPEQDTQMHVDPYTETQNSLKSQPQGNNAVTQNNEFNLQTVTHITTIPEVQVMVGVNPVQVTNQPIDHQMKEVMVSPTEPQQQQLYQQIPARAENIPMSGDVNQVSMATQGFKGQIPANSVPMQNLPITSNNQNYQNIQQPSHLSGQNFQGVLPVSVPSQIYQSPPAEQQHVTGLTNPTPMQAQPYQSPEATAKSPPMMAPPNSAQGFQPMPLDAQQQIPVQNQQLSIHGSNIPAQNHSLPMQQNQPGPLQSQSVPMQNQSMQVQNQSMQVQNQSMSMQNQSMSVQNQSMPVQNQSVSVQNQSVSVQNQSMSVQNQSMPVQNQSMSVQNQSIPIQTQSIQIQNPTISSPNQPLPVQNQVVSMQNQSYGVQTQAVPIQDQSQNQPMPVQNAPMSAQSQTMPVQQTQAVPVPQNQSVVHNQSHPMQAQQPSTGTGTMHIPMPSNFIYQGNNNNVTIQQRPDTNQSTPVQHAQMPHQNSNVERPMEPRSPNMYAMTTLLQSIDGSQNLEAITREDVQRHCQ